MKLIILAAGQGTRLRPLTEDRPKPVVRLKNGKTILETSIENLQSEFDFDEVVIISGYKEEKLTEVVKNINVRCSIDVVHNSFYDSAGPIISLSTVSHKIWTDNCIIINGDIIYFEDFVNHFISLGQGINIGYSPVENPSEDEMKVVCDSSQPKLMNVGKDISVGYDGVSSGLVHVEGERCREKLVKNINQAVEKDVWMPWHNLMKLVHFEKDNQYVELIEVPYESWHEIDTVEDLEEAEDLL